MSRARAPTRRIKRLLIANRGEIATRIISCARELSIETFAIYVDGDDSHTLGAAHAIRLESSASFMSIEDLIKVAKLHNIDSVHPGYGFLSESENFSRRMWEDIGVSVVGPGWGILEETGNKLRARSLAEECRVPVCPALAHPTSKVEDVRQFVGKVGLPVMIKAVDGGGGRGIRLIREHGALESSFKRAIEESPSKQVFAERAAVDGFRHVEVQIVGDGTGKVTHLYERECSIQRRYQKVIELAPSLNIDRGLVAKVIQSSLRMASHIRYFSLGTFEFLFNPQTDEYYFLEINPRLQVEHTVTESITMTDIVKTQLLISQGASLEDCGLSDDGRQIQSPPRLHCLQLRITAEDVEHNWSLSIGKITNFRFPTGHGIRIDTHLTSGHAAVVSTDFDSLIAKLIITGSSWRDATQKAARALEDTQISGVKTNLGMLRAIVGHQDFLGGQCDTQWLEARQDELLRDSRQLSEPRMSRVEFSNMTSIPSLNAASNTVLRKGDSWSAVIAPISKQNNQQQQPPCHLELTRVLRNQFPSSLSIELLFTTPQSSPGSQPCSMPYKITLSSTSASASATTSQRQRGNPSDPSHICIPFSGKLIEVLVDEGDTVKEGDVICIVQQMKMELEVRSPRNGVLSWVTDAEDGEDVTEGMLAAIIQTKLGNKL